MPDIATHLMFDDDPGERAEVWAHHIETDTWTQLPLAEGAVGGYGLEPIRDVAGTWEIEVRWPKREQDDA